MEGSTKLIILGMVVALTVIAFIHLGPLVADYRLEKSITQIATGRDRASHVEAGRSRR